LNFGGILPDGNYRLLLPAGSVNDSANNALAADYVFDFFVLTADANHDRSVNTIDFNLLAANFAQSGKTFSQGDFDYSGTVDTIDFNLLAANFAKTLAPGSIANAPAAKAVSPGAFSEMPVLTSDDLLEVLNASGAQSGAR